MACSDVCGGPYCTQPPPPAAPRTGEHAGSLWRVFLEVLGGLHPFGLPCPPPPFVPHVRGDCLITKQGHARCRPGARCGPFPEDTTHPLPFPVGLDSVLRRCSACDRCWSRRTPVPRLLGPAEECNGGERGRNPLTGIPYPTTLVRSQAVMHNNVGDNSTPRPQTPRYWTSSGTHTGRRDTTCSAQTAVGPRVAGKSIVRRTWGIGACRGVCVMFGGGGGARWMGQRGQTTHGRSGRAKFRDPLVWPPTFGQSPQMRAMWPLSRGLFVCGM